MLVGLGCGGKSRSSNNYQGSIDRQEACCRNLADPAAQSECISRIVRVDDPEVQASELNQATYSCLVSNFQCDAMTGTISKEASQLVYDCITDLEQ